MKHVKETLVLFSLILFISCQSTSTLPTAQFRTNYTLKELTGTYLSGKINPKNDLAYIMMGGYPSEQNIEYVSLRFNGKDSLNVKLLSDFKVIKELNYIGKIEGNFFEIYFRKQSYILPPVLVNYNITKARLGLTEDNQLLVHFWRDKTNGTLVFYNTEKRDEGYLYERILDDKRYLLKNDYDAMTVRDSENIYKVRKDSLWALFDDSAKQITGFEYSFIGTYDKYMRGYLVSRKSLDKPIGKCQGYINVSGRPIIPVQYDYVDDTNIKNLKKISINGKIGFAFSGRIICPPVLRESSDTSLFETLSVKGADPNMRYCQVRYKGASYYLGIDGYLYPYSVNTLTRKVKKVKSEYRFRPE